MKSLTARFAIQPELFTLTHGYDYDEEVLEKTKERFQGTGAAITMKEQGEAENMDLLRRLAITTTVYDDAHLRNINFYPLTLLQSEFFLKEGKFNTKNVVWEDLALLLFDTDGANKQEALALQQSIVDHRDIFKIKNDGKEKLLVVNAGLEKDDAMLYGVKPIVLPGLTEVYAHPVLDYVGEWRFTYGLDRGLPFPDGIGKDRNKGTRTLYMPSERHSLGLRPLFRYGAFALNGSMESLQVRGLEGRITFAQRDGKDQK